MKFSRDISRYFWLANGIWWLSWISLHVFLMYSLDVPLSICIGDSLVSNVLLASIGILVSLTFKNYQPSTGKEYIPLIWGIVLAFIYNQVMMNVLGYLYQSDEFYWAIVTKTKNFRFAFGLLMIQFLILLNWIWYYIKSEQAGIERKRVAEDLVKEAELSKLRQQLQPHFLFNSLNSISALVNSRPEEARKMIHQLSDFLRGTLRKDEHQLVSMKEELTQLELYLEIEKVRFGHRLKTSIQYEAPSLEKKLPALILQPIVENAIKFGLYDTIDDIEIKINIHSDAKHLEINVENPFDATTSMPQSGTGFGLSSVKRRLYLLYARNDLLQVAHAQGVYTTTIKIPQ